jgi:hypothetical protein
LTLVRGLIARHVELTGSAIGRRILDTWTNTCDIWNLPEANILLIVRISGSVGHK